MSHHGLGHGHRLALASRQRRHGLADRPDRGDRELLQRLRASTSMAASSSIRWRSGSWPRNMFCDDVQVVAEREVLIDRRDPERLGFLGSVQVNRIPLPHDLATVGRPETRDRLDRDRLARPVVAAQRGDLAGRDTRLTESGRGRARSSCSATQLQSGASPLREPSVVVEVLMETTHDWCGARPSRGARGQAPQRVTVRRTEPYFRRCRFLQSAA